MTWKPTPQKRMVMARRLDLTTGVWAECQYKDLRSGDFFKAFAGDQQIDAISREFADSEDWVALCHSDPVHGAPPYRDKNEGYMIEVSTGLMSDLLKRFAS